MNTPAVKDNNNIKFSINVKEKGKCPLIQVSKFEGAYQNDLTKKVEDEKCTKEYLNEKLTYFYNNGGPIMDI